MVGDDEFALLEKQIGTDFEMSSKDADVSLAQFVLATKDGAADRPIPEQAP